MPTLPLPVLLALQPVSFFDQVSVPWPNHTLASTIPAPSLAGPYIPQAANISDKVRVQILQGKDINLFSLLSPSRDATKNFFTGNNTTAVLKASDPRPARDITIWEFLVAFGVMSYAQCTLTDNENSIIFGPNW